MPKILDLTGLTYGRLTVLERTADRSGTSYKWLCSCSCGNTTSVASNNLRTGHTTSCGCYWKEVAQQLVPTHGMSKSPEYRTWCKIKERCYDENCKAYPDYGAKGIIMQEEWKDSFESFYRYVGDKPSPLHSMGRIKNALGYVEGNVRWETDEQQARNKTFQSNNTTGFSGVTLVNKVSKLGRDNWTYVAFWVENGKQTNKCFSIKKHGLLPAFAKACAYRVSMIAQLNANGAGYSPEHGK